MAHAFLLAAPVGLRQRCTKVPWPSRKIAMRIVRRTRKDSGTTVIGVGAYRAYRCPICHAWHTGHEPRHKP